MGIPFTDDPVQMLHAWGAILLCTVQQLLARLLLEPWADHQVLARELLQGGPLCDAHVHGPLGFAASPEGQQLLREQQRSRIAQPAREI